ncbi:hypothetical protein JYP51_02780 [Ponticoccus gilvus]|nr:hypothetical protein [Enemella evansiae]
MSDALTNFRKRDAALRKKHVRMARGYRNKLKSDGLIVQEPDDKLGDIGLRLLSFALVVFMGFKVMVLTGLGAEAYSLHLAHLAEGSVYERAGAWLMQIDPVTRALAALVAPLFS